MSLRIATPVLLILHVYTACSDIIAGSAYAYHLSRTWGAWGMVKPGNPADNPGKNIYFFVNIFLLFGSAFFLCFAIIEFLMCFMSLASLDRVRWNWMRPVAYIFFGCLTLGVCASLGIAGGSMVMIAGVVWLVLVFVAVQN